MDPPIINEASFSAANPSSYSLSELWSFPISGASVGSGDLGGLGLRMGSFSGFCGDATAASVDESTVTEHSGSRCASAGRKRKDVNSEDESSKIVSTSSANDLKASNSKRMKASGASDENGDSKTEGETSSGTGKKANEQVSKPEPPKDYIHVRARRGQATDSHSLAERARREKISERMKILQDLVPGCNKVIGKALVLDEIINYIQSLQRQVEFLSMKLEAINSRMNPTIEGFHSKDLAAPTFDATGILFSSQAPREYTEGAHSEWLHMQVGGRFERAT